LIVLAAAVAAGASAATRAAARMAGSRAVMPEVIDSGRDNLTRLL
jgi:hypothetical protein